MMEFRFWLSELHVSRLNPTYVFQADNREHAIEQFKEAIWDGESDREEAQATCRESHGKDAYINSVMVSDTPITNPPNEE
jgi:hypothetical protein